MSKPFDYFGEAHAASKGHKEAWEVVSVNKEGHETVQTNFWTESSAEKAAKKRRDDPRNKYLERVYVRKRK